MSNVKTLTTIAIAALFAAPAFAQDADEGLILDIAPNIVASDFTSADLDQDGSLNADEFVTFAVMRAEDGDEAFTDIVMGGEYDATFAAHDTDASGGIEPSELGVHGEETAEPEMVEPELEELLVPEL